MDLAVISGNPMAASGTSSWYMKIIAIGGRPNGRRAKNAHYIFHIEMERIRKPRKCVVAIIQRIQPSIFFINEMKLYN